MRASQRQACTIPYAQVLASQGTVRAHKETARGRWELLCTQRLRYTSRGRQGVGPRQLLSRLKVRRWISWDLPPFCPALEVCKGLFQDARNRKLMYGGVPRTLGSAEKREQGLSWKGQQSSDPLK